jgi:hypothetical protein
MASVPTDLLGLSLNQPISGIGKFKGAILDEFGVEAAVGAEVDVLEENPHMAGLSLAPG